MSSDDEKAAIQARFIDKIRRKEPGWQEASLGLFLLKASEPPAREDEIIIEKVTNTAPAASPHTGSSSIERSSPTPQATQRAASALADPILADSKWIPSWLLAMYVEAR